MEDDDQGLHREAREWLEGMGERVSAIESLPGDVSMRRYLRVWLHDDRTTILAVYPEPNDPALDRFLATTRLLEAFDIRVPEVRAWDSQRALVWVEDLGTSTLYDLRDRGWKALEPFLMRAAEILSRIARLPPGEVETLNPPLDEALLERELEVGWRLFLEPHGIVREQGVGSELEGLLREVCRQLDRVSWVPAHRDFMARNLVPIGEDDVAVLDHQDLRLGAPTYDIASLLNDSLYPDPVLAGRLRATAKHPSEPSSIYHAAVVQRTLKIIGTFERFARRGGVRYRSLIPQSLDRFLSSVGQVEVDGRRVGKSLEVELRKRLPPEGPGT